MATLGIDFGTSNTAAAVAAGGRPFVIPLENGREIVPTAVFLDYAARDMLFGNAAVTALTSGREGRFMRALKRVLGTPVMREPRQLLNRRMTLIEVVAAFLSEIREKTGAVTGLDFTHALSGRPVLFHADPARDRAAEADLADCYRAAGFAGVDFLFEPEAAALAAGPEGGLGLVVDIGGGTSDFTLFREEGGMRVLASRGLRIGGTDFDRALSLAHAMPELGLGGLLRAMFGDQRTEAPVALFHDLATWEKIAFLYTPETRRAAADMMRVAVDPAPFRRLCAVLRDETGHDIAFAVERAKIAANGGTGGRIDLSVAEPGLTRPLPRAALDAAVAPHAAAIAEHALATVAAGGAAPDEVARVVMVGGSGLMGAVRAGIAAAFPDAGIVQAGAFSAVAEGLGLAAAARDGQPRLAAITPGA